MDEASFIKVITNTFMHNHSFIQFYSCLLVVKGINEIYFIWAYMSLFGNEELISSDCVMTPKEKNVRGLSSLITNLNIFIRCPDLSKGKVFLKQ